MLTSLCKCDNLSRERHNLRTLYTHMKKTLITLVALATASVASADITGYYSMSTLVGSGTTDGKVSGGTTVAGTTYTFNGGSIIGINNDALEGAFTGTGYVSIGAYVNLAENAPQYNTIFGYGAGGQGFKLTLKDGVLTLVAKGNVEYVSNLTALTAGTSTFVGLTLDLAASSATLYAGDNSYDIASLSMNANSSATPFAISSQTCDSGSETLYGSISDLTVITSDTALTSSNIQYAVQTTIPEPTTATLSLLALAGLAARRRRK